MDNCVCKSAIFDPFSQELMDGLHVIEASAGTGKTYSITTMVLRILVEKKLPIESILAVTFTNAAAKELSERIRRRIKDALIFLKTSYPNTDNPDYSSIFVKNIEAEKFTKKEAVSLLEQALASADKASFFTIHSFCKKMLEDYAFETNQSYSNTLCEDIQYVLNQIAEDFWRANSQNLLQYRCLRNVFTSLDFLKVFSKTLSDTDVEILPIEQKKYSTSSNSAKTVDQVLEVFETLFNEATSAKEKFALYVDSLSLDSKEKLLCQLSKAFSSNCDKVTGILSFLEKNYAESSSVLNLFYVFTDSFVKCPSWKEDFVKDFFVYLHVSGIFSARLANGVSFNSKDIDLDLFPPNVQSECKLAYDYYICFKNCCRKLFDIIEAKNKLYYSFKLNNENFANFKYRMHQDYANWFNEQKTVRLKTLSLQSFNDLLTNLAKALKGPLGGYLADLIQKRYPAALIDEFQDTDSLQWEIFRRIYLRGEDNSKSALKLVPGSILLLIGDPKQSIYAFRGADLDAYLDAKELAYSIGKVWHMSINYRSEPNLINAINSWAEYVKDGCFEVSELNKNQKNIEPKNQSRTIRFENVKPCSKWENEKEAFLTIPEKDASLMFYSENRYYTSKSQLNLKKACETQVRKITRYLLDPKNGYRLNGKALKNKDIAILVSTNRRAESIYKALKEWNIPAVIVTDITVYKSSEAKIFRQILECVLNPLNKGLIRGLVVKGALNVKLADLLSFNHPDDNPGNLSLVEDELQSLFVKLKATWDKYGVSAMLEEFADSQQLFQRWIGYKNFGERSVANFRHLCELVSRREIKFGRQPNKLFLWLTEKMSVVNDLEKDSEDEVRLESEIDRVQVITIHKAKGLEYPVVICADMWEPLSSNRYRTNKRQIFSRKDENKERRRYYALDTSYDDTIAKADQEEALRKFYVAITRAKNQLWLVLPEVGVGKTAAFCKSPLTLWKAQDWIKTQAANTAVAHTVNSSFFDQQKEPVELKKNLNFERDLVYQCRRNSYSSLLPGVGELSTANFSEELAPLKDMDSDLSSNNDNLVQDFEQNLGSFDDSDCIVYPDNLPVGVDFGSFVHGVLENVDFIKDPSRNQKIKDMCLANINYANYVEPLMDLFKRTLDTVLHPLDCCLSDLKWQQCAKEMEFCFNIPGELKVEELYKICGIKDKAPQSLQGFLMGFMDLVFEYKGKFYLADYKTNDLRKYCLEPNTVPQKIAYCSYFMDKAIKEHSYDLQYHIYSLALQRFLKMRIPNYSYQEHYGGVFYLFVRGMGLGPNAPSTGIHYAKVSPKVLKGLEQFFSQGDK